MYVAILAAVALTSTVFLTCGGPTRQERIREQADRIYVEISQQSAQQTCEQFQEILRRVQEDRGRTQLDIVEVEIELNDELFETVARHDRDNVRRELESLLRDPCREP